MTDERLAKLPAWVRGEFMALRAELAAERTRNAELSMKINGLTGVVRTRVALPNFHGLDTGGGKDAFLRDRTVIRSLFGEGLRHYVDARIDLDEDGVTLRGSDPLLIEPTVSNAVLVSLKERQ